ncbi:hypothetical protein [Amaricoccus macauensis]|uniref:hypothetical protein n=1 Tax=Amaricoccus macauensis TaxID=57001 RepID=UPI003C7DF546
MAYPVSGGLTPEFAYDFHPVFPARLFELRDIRAVLKEAGVALDSKENRMPVFRHGAARLAFAEAADRVKEAMWNAGWGLNAEFGDEDGSEDNRAERLAARIREKIAAERAGLISHRAMLHGIKQLHRFEGERMKGRMIDPGALRDHEGESRTGSTTLKPLDIWRAQVLINSADQAHCQ